MLRFWCVWLVGINATSLYFIDLLEGHVILGLTLLPVIAADPALSTWLTLLFVTNLISLFVNINDVYRFTCGEHAPHYKWRLSAG